MFTKENNVLSEQNTIAFIVVYTILSTVAGIFKSIIDTALTVTGQ